MSEILRPAFMNSRRCFSSICSMFQLIPIRIPIRPPFEPVSFGPGRKKSASGRLLSELRQTGPRTSGARLFLSARAEKQTASGLLSSGAPGSGQKGHFTLGCWSNRPPVPAGAHLFLSARAEKNKRPPGHYFPEARPHVPSRPQAVCFFGPPGESVFSARAEKNRFI